jgi:hypothetical protein
MLSATIPNNEAKGEKLSLSPNAYMKRAITPKFTACKMFFSTLT